MKKLYLYKVFSENYTCPGLTKRAICLKYKRGAYGSPFHFLDFSRGQGYAITNEEDFDKPDEESQRPVYC